MDYEILSKQLLDLKSYRQDVVERIAQLSKDITKARAEAFYYGNRATSVVPPVQEYYDRRDAASALVASLTGQRDALYAERADLSHKISLARSSLDYWTRRKKTRVSKTEADDMEFFNNAPRDADGNPDPMALSFEDRERFYDIFNRRMKNTTPDTAGGATNDTAPPVPASPFEIDNP